MRKTLLVVASGVALGGALAVGAAILIGQFTDGSVPRFRADAPASPEVSEVSISEAAPIGLAWSRIRGLDNEFRSDRWGPCNRARIQAQECDQGMHGKNAETAWQAYAGMLTVVQAIPWQPETRGLLSNMATYVNLRTAQFSREMDARWYGGISFEGISVDTFQVFLDAQEQERNLFALAFETMTAANQLMATIRDQLADLGISAVEP